MRRISSHLVVAIALIVPGSAAAQQVISAKSGLVHYIEGRVELDGKPGDLRFGQFPEIKEGSVLRTGEGRAEILLTPGVFLRLGENSAMRMHSNRLSSTKVEILEGSALVECAELLKDNAVSFVVADAEVAIRKTGLYRFDTPSWFRVYEGEAEVTSGDKTLVVKGSRQADLATLVAAEKFDSKTGDPLYRWAKRRSSYLAVANLSAARKLERDNIRSTGWVFNPYFGMLTFVPVNGLCRSVFGYNYYSPQRVYAVYAPPRRVETGWASMGPRYNPSLGYSTVSRSAGAGAMGGGAPAAAGSVAAGSGASAARTGDSSSGRGSDGGRGR